jgi:hypothetical protein
LVMFFLSFLYMLLGVEDTARSSYLQAARWCLSSVIFVHIFSYNALLILNEMDNLLARKIWQNYLL